jgi:uncharacterized protein YjbI with pentapeptide repeats/cell wall assembly regulator SMI1
LQEACDDWEQMSAQSFRDGPFGNQFSATWQQDWFPLLRANHSAYVSVRLASSDHTPLFLFPPPQDQREIAVSINELLEILTLAIEKQGYVYDPYAHILRGIDGLRFLPRIDQPWLDELPYDLPGEGHHFGAQTSYPVLCCVPVTSRLSELSDQVLHQSVSQSWQIISSTLQQLAPALASDLASGVSPNDLTQTENRLYLRFPEEVKQWYTFCNGRREISFMKYFMDGWRWYPLEELERGDWEVWLEGSNIPPEPIEGKYRRSADPRIQLYWWHPYWIPFMTNVLDGCLLCIDLAPTPQGEVGQIILLMNKNMFYVTNYDIRAVSPVIWVAPNLRVFLAAFAQDIQQGRYLFDTKHDTLWSQEGFSYVMNDENLRFTLSGLDRQQREQLAPESVASMEEEEERARVYLAALQEMFSNKGKVMTNHEQLALIRQGTTVWNGWRKEHAHIVPNLHGIKLISMELNEVNLSEVDLSESRLSGSQLENADLRRANLSHANFFTTNLSGADLSEANLQGAEMSLADLNGTQLKHANLNGANLRGVDLSNANLQNANLVNARLENTNLRSANLTFADLTGASLRGADLSNANLQNACLIDAHLRNANLSGAHLEGADLNHVHFNDSV